MTEIKVMTNNDEQFEVKLAGIPNSGHYIEFEDRHFLVDSIVHHENGTTQISVVEMF